MKTLTLFICIVSYLCAITETNAQKTEITIKKELTTKLGYLVAYESTGGKLHITKTDNHENVQQIFESATGLNVEFEECLKNDFFFNFKNAEVEVWIQFGNLKYKKNGKIRFRELSKKQRIELKKIVTL